MSVEWKKIGDCCVIEKKSIIPQATQLYSLYSLPAFDNGKRPEIVSGEKILSSKLVVSDNTILYNKLNVKFQRVWNLKAVGDHTICSSEYLPIKTKIGTDQNYLYYVLTSKQITNAMHNARKGTSCSQQRIDANTLLNYEIPFPPIEEQRKIAHCLETLDDKIESNKRVNDILQQQAHAIYCELTNGRFNACLGDLITEMPKSKIKVSEAKETMGDYPFFTSGKAVLNYHTALVSGRKIFLNTGGNADVKYYIGEASYSTDTWCIEGKSGLTDFLYLALYDYLPEIEQICFEGSALRHLQKAKLKSLPICIPSIDENMPLFCVIKSIFDRQSANIQENKRLAALRDTLLPKLMRGEIDVSNVQI